MGISPGLHGEIEITVTEQDTAKSLGSGEVAVLGTPRVLALCEAASLAALADAMDPGTTTVGMRVQLEHIAPSAIGAIVKAESNLEKVEGRRLTFTVSAHEDGRLVAAGKVTRVVVTTEDFLGRLD
ncbi:MAG: hotdog domain-containing protein [Microthrixaceae bacterium]|nr:thioesterase [Microthrixaceae bacterium]